MKYRRVHYFTTTLINSGTLILQTEETKEEIADNDVEDESSKDEEELATFWREAEELVFSARNGHKLKDIAKYEVTVKNTLPFHLHLADIEAEKKVP